MEIDNWQMENSPLSSAKNPEISGLDNDSPMFNGVGTEKVEALKQTVSEINEMIGGREDLSGDIFNEGEKLKKEIDLSIVENERTPMADKRDIMKENNDLKHKKINISELQLNERVSCWKDIALLKKEKREYERELNEKEARAKLFSGIMEDN